MFGKGKPRGYVKIQKAARSKPEKHGENDFSAIRYRYC